MFSMREAYLAGNQQGFDDIVQQFRDLDSTIFTNNKIKVSDPGLELIYNNLNPFLFSKIFYGIAALLSLFTLSLLWKRAYQISIFFCIVGLILHTVGLILRMVIMSHPPITTLYETFVFTAWVLVMLGMILELIKIRSLGVVTASLTGFIFLHIAGKYSRDGDTMGMLSAVLDSSFWLTTHIVTIALGYAGFVAAGLIAHIYIFQKVFTKTDENNLHSILRAVYGIFIFGFIFTITGTLLGGMWADQAWGRFWGWDPKENGALLIIIWGLIVLHSRLGGLIKDTGLAVGAVIGVMLVMCTWVGVNLLGIGLHSYGFSSTGASAFFTYIGFELIFLTVSYIWFFVKSKGSHPHLVKSSR
jgi:ABC-type transport system involved in cytochrome c biogenesis permease subunit